MAEQKRTGKMISHNRNMRSLPLSPAMARQDSNRFGIDGKSNKI